MKTERMTVRVRKGSVLIAIMYAIAGKIRGIEDRGGQVEDMAGLGQTYRGSIANIDQRWRGCICDHGDAD